MTCALTPRETECLGLIADGLRDNEAAAHLHCSPRTVRFHVTNAIDKLHANNRTHAAVLAVRAGLLPERKPAA